MKTRLTKGRPRLVAKEGYRAASENPWVDEKESDITSISSHTNTSDDSELSDEDSMMTDDMEHTIGHDETGVSDEDDEDDETKYDNDSTMEQTVEPNLTPNEDSRTGSESDVSPLFSAIESEDWKSVLNFLETGSWGWKLSSLCAQLYQVNEKSVDEQVRTWVTTTKKDRTTEVCRLPIHAAIVKMAPFAIIEALVMHYANGVRHPDSEGNFPLHLAFGMSSSIQTLTFLMKEFRGALFITNEAGKLPTECGSANGLAEFLQIGIDGTKSHMEGELTKEKGNLEEDRKQLLEVTKELMNLKKIVAERERSMTKDNFLYQKQHLNTAISQLTKLKTDLDRHEGNVLQTHLVAEKQRMDGVLGELNKTKGELEMIKAGKNQGDAPPSHQPTAASAPVQKKKKSKKSKKEATKVEKREATEVQMKLPPRTSVPKNGVDNEVDPEEEATIDAILPNTPRDAPVTNESTWDASMLTVDTAEFQHYNMEEAHAHETSETATPSSKTSARSPTKIKKKVAARFKKRMSWIGKEKQQLPPKNE